MAVTTTETVLANQRPRFSVEDTPEAQLDSDLLSLEVRHDEDGLSSLEARFNNVGSTGEGGGSGYRWLDGEVLSLGKAIKVAAGEADNEGLLFSGVITALTGSWAATRGAEVTICAEDASMLLRMGQTTRTWEESTDSDIAEQIAHERGLTADVSVDGPTHTQLWQVNETDLSVLRRRARAVDARIEVGDQTLAFVSRRGDEPPDAIPLTTLGELLNFQATADLAHQRTEVQVHGWSVADKQAIHATATSDAVSAESAGGSTGPSVLDDLGWDAVESHHLEVPSTEPEAQELADAMMRRRARRFLYAKGMTSGTPTMRVGSRLDVADAGPLFSGHWTVASLRHRFDHRGLRTLFVAERTDLGGRG